MNLFEKFPGSEMKRLVGPAKPVAGKELLAVGSGREPLDEIDVVVHVALGGFDVDHVTDAVRHLIKAQLVPSTDSWSILVFDFDLFFRLLFQQLFLPHNVYHCRQVFDGEGERGRRQHVTVATQLIPAMKSLETPVRQIVNFPPGNPVKYLCRMKCDWSSTESSKTCESVRDSRRARSKHKKMSSWKMSRRRYMALSSRRLIRSNEMARTLFKY